MKVKVEAARFPGRPEDVAIKDRENRWHAVVPMFDGSPGLRTQCGYEVKVWWDRGRVWEKQTDRCLTCERALAASEKRRAQ
jgi:hypothetical protein